MANLVRVGGGGKKEKLGNPIIPIMSSNTIPNGYVVSANDSSANAYIVFDKSTSSWFTENIYDAWVQIKLPNGKVAKWVMVHPLYSEGLRAQDIVVQGSNDGTTFESLGSHHFTNANHGRTYFELENNTSYLYYRFKIVGNYVGSRSGLVEAQLYDDTPIYYLYKDGKQSVAWDNSGYAYSSAYTSDGGATLNESDFSFLASLSSMHNRAIITDSKVDLSDYSTVKMLCSYGGSEHTYTLDVSAMSGNYYVAVTVANNSSAHYLALTLGNTKENFLQTLIKRDEQSVSNNATIYVYRVWLEK